MYSKTLILSSLKQYPSNTPRAIVTFINNPDSILGKVRLYNLKTLDDGVKMGLYIDGEVKTMELIPKFESFEFYIPQKIDLNKELYCALINTKNNNEVVLCGGSYAGYFSKQENEDEVFISSQTNEESLKAEESDPCPNCDCENCEYKKYFYEQHPNVKNKVLEEETTSQNLCEEKISTSSEKNSHKMSKEEISLGLEEIFNDSQKETSYPLEEEIASKGKEQNTDLKKVDMMSEGASKENEEADNLGENFLAQISEQLDEMFARYPLDETIMKIIPDSKIIKVTDTVDGKPYILGIMYENNAIKYLVYGVPSNYSQKAPIEFGENYNWLPLDPEKPYADGYYLIYQDASNGKLVPIKVE